MTQRYSSKVRYGKGFSLQELSKAKISPAFARSVGIAVDQRRHDPNEETLQLNVQRLESYKSKLILFPRKENKIRQGDIPDTAQIAQSSVSQNTSKHVIEKPAKKVRQTPKKITKDITEVKIFIKLRQLRINEKYSGKRIKKAKEEAAKKE